ncbi:MAG: S41 family peptidase [Pseudorhodoplanes sp.]
MRVAVSIGIALIPVGAIAPMTASASAQAVSPPAFDVRDLHRNDISRTDTDRFLTRAQGVEDLEAVRRVIRSTSSYIWATTFPLDAAIARMQQQLPLRVSVNGLSTQINKLLRLFGDDHAQVVDWDARVPQGFAPFRVGKIDTRYFLYASAPAGLINPDFPFVRSIDGTLIEDWMRAAGDIGQGPLSSASARFGRAYRVMENINYMRTELGLPMAPAITVELVSEDGDRSMTMHLPVLSERPAWPKPFHLDAPSRVLAGNIGYLRVPAHTGPEATRFVAGVDAEMAWLRGTRALIIDARQSGGGKREVLNALFPYFIAPGAPPYVFNVAKVRIPDDGAGFDPLKIFDSPDKRLLYVLDPTNPKDEADAYRAFAVSFRPAWQPPAGKFTDWYFMTLRADAKKPYYTRPVYLLIDWGLGSAGDIFTSAFKGWPNVTLVGTPTMGRSGQGEKTKLPNSGLQINISTMASFQKTGERYDTVGIQPDIAMEPALSDWFGATDSVLDRVAALAAARVPR